MFSLVDYQLFIAECIHVLLGLYIAAEKEKDENKRGSHSNHKESTFGYDYQKKTFEDDFENETYGNYYKKKTFERDYENGTYGNDKKKSTLDTKMTLWEALSILEITPKISKTEVDQAYRKVMLEHHPDKGGTHQKAIKINEARNFLQNLNVK